MDYILIKRHFKTCFGIVLSLSIVTCTGNECGQGLVYYYSTNVNIYNTSEVNFPSGYYSFVSKIDGLILEDYYNLESDADIEQNECWFPNEEIIDYDLFQSDEKYSGIDQDYCSTKWERMDYIKYGRLTRGACEVLDLSFYIDDVLVFSQHYNLEYTEEYGNFSRDLYLEELPSLE